MGSINVRLFLICFVLCVCDLKSVKAQSWDEWFHQKKTQIKYLEQQIAALKAEEISLRQGYDMLKSEWNTIANFKGAEFNLHQDFYNSLSAVNPVIRNEVNLSAVQARLQSIVNQFNAVDHLAGLTETEQTYISRVRENLVEQCHLDLNDLQTVLTTGGLQMSDDERIKRINEISAAINDKYVFACSFTNRVRLLSAQRNRDKSNTQTLRRYYEIN
ncbi:hypothetical protein FHW88_003358 [Mucilaginibacter sp. SG538B]|uniref:hypothetical protein n=1 Tax=Mucilaginibacter sp. SG538B TaxID=2587021 RepID=UPI00159E7BBD|nr:hypothetical protein [Mucilaginibacter sp. SG538B]NVM65054.1 hypothetical protein [Mucilaginibacter sp. SG538B]